MIQTHNRSLLLYLLIVFFGALLVYRLWLPNEFSGDDLQYTMVIQKAALGDFFYHPAGGQAYVPQDQVAFLKHSPHAPSINPRYLLEWPTSTLAARLWSVFGWQGSSIVPIQAIRMIVGALGLVLFFLAVDQLISNHLLTLVATIGVGISDAYWIYSTHMDQSINMLALLCLAFYLFVRQSKTGTTLRKQMILAAVLAFASFYNFTAAVSAFAFAIGIGMLHPDAKWSSKFMAFIRFGLMYAIIVVVVIAGSIILFVSPASLTSGDYWRSVTFSGKPEYNIAVFADAVRAVLGLAKSQILFPGISNSFQDFFDSASTVTRAALVIYYVVVVVIMALPFVWLIIRRQKLGDKRKVVAFLVIWLAAHSLFNWFWDPGFNKYWLVPLVCIWAVAAIALDHLQTLGNRLYRPALWGAVAFIVISFILNLSTQFLPQANPANNPWLNIAQEVGKESQPADLFVSTAPESQGHPLDFYLDYFGRRDVLSSGLITYEVAGDTSVAPQRLEPRMAAHLSDGGKIYVYGVDDLTPDDRQAFLAHFGSSTLKAVWTFPELTIYEVVF